VKVGLAEMAEMAEMVETVDLVAADLAESVGSVELVAQAALATHEARGCSHPTGTEAQLDTWGQPSVRCLPNQRLACNSPSL